MLGTQLFLQEDAAPKHGCGTVRGNDRRAHGDVRIVRQRVDVEELTDRFADGTDVLRRFGARGQLFVLDENDVRARNQTGEEEGQLVGDVRGILIQRFQNEAVGECSRRIENTIGNRQEQRKQGLGILVIARLLTGGAKLVVLGRFRDAQRDDADGNQRDGGKLPGVHIADARGCNGQNRDQRAGGIANRRGDGQLDVTQTDVAHRHGDDVQQGNRQVGQDDLHVDFNAADKDLVAGVQTHDDTDRHDHFQVRGLVVGFAAADLGEKVRTAPAEQRDDRKPKPHKYLSKYEILLKRND